MCMPSLSTNLFALFFNLRGLCSAHEPGNECFWPMWKANWVHHNNNNNNGKRMKMNGFEWWNSWEHCFIYINMAGASSAPLRFIHNSVVRFIIFDIYLKNKSNVGITTSTLVCLVPPYTQAHIIYKHGSTK